MRVRVVETLSQVWKTCILTAVLHPHIIVNQISELKFRRLVVSRFEARLYIEREAKTAKIRNFSQKLGWDIGIEPTTFWTTIRRSNHLS